MNDIELIERMITHSSSNAFVNFYVVGFEANMLSKCFRPVAFKFSGFI